ncbi:MAG: peptide chain release factor N(5)-glutamine methyltransferase [Desulfobacterales bacterium]|nr:peptide chain release factor N(5)-glutamine methyltransferase [Desulfobacterales bacterium]
MSSDAARDDWTILDLLKWTTDYFKGHAIDSPRSTAEILLAYTLSVQRIDLYLRYDQPLNPGELQQFKALIKRRISREPVAYIVGRKEFWGLDFEVQPGTLIPRPETECLVEAALGIIDAGVLPRTWKILELGTGSGAVIMALAKERPGLRYFASDRSCQTLDLAHRNALANGLDGVIHFFAGDWFAPIAPDGDRMDMVVSNPPYINSDIIATLQPEINRFEPAAALDGGVDGLACIRRIMEQAPDYVVPGGCLLLETGHDQHPVIEDLVTRHPDYARVDFSKDYSGYDRIACLTLAA